MENILVIKNVNNGRILTDHAGRVLDEEDIHNLTTDAINSFGDTTISLNEEIIVIDGEDYQLFIVADDTTVADYDKTRIEAFTEEFEALLAEQDLFLESVDPAIEDCIENYLSGEYDPEEDDDDNYGEYGDDENEAEESPRDLDEE